MNLGRIVQQRRIELGMSQEELANKMGYKSRSSINKIENGRPVTQKIIVRLAEALNTTPAHLMGWDQDSINAASEAQKDADNYDDSIEQELQNFMLELSEMGFEPSEMKRIMDYAQIVKTINSESDELHKAFIDLFTKMYKLELSIDDLNAVYTYAQMLKNNKKG